MELIAVSVWFKDSWSLCTCCLQGRLSSIKKTQPVHTPSPLFPSQSFACFYGPELPAVIMMIILGCVLERHYKLRVFNGRTLPLVQGSSSPSLTGEPSKPDRGKLTTLPVY